MSALSIGELVGYVSVDDSDVAPGLSGIGGMLKGAASSWKGILAAGGAAAGAALAASVVKEMDVEAGTDKLAAQLGLTEQQAGVAGAAAGSLYSQAYGESMGEVNTALDAVMSSFKGMRNASQADLEAVTATALNFSETFETDVARSVQVAGGLIKSGLAGDAVEAFDLLTAASQKVPAALREDVLDATEEYGQFFKTIGLDGEQAMAMLVKGSEKGMYGIDKVGDAVKEFSIRATDMSTTSSEAYEAIGLDAETMANKILAGGDTAAQGTQQVIDGLLSMKNPAKQAQAAIALFGTPLEDLNVSEIPKFLKGLQAGGDALGNWEGAAERAGNTLNDNATTNLTTFTRTLKSGLVNVLGGSVIPYVNRFASVLADNVGPALVVLGQALSSTVGFLSAHGQAVTVIAGLIAALLLPRLVQLAAAYVRTQLAAIKAWAVQNAAAIKSAALMAASVVRMVAGWVLLAAKSLASAARVAAAWLIAMGPVGAVIAIVVGLVALIIAKWDTIKAVTIKVWNAIVGWLSDAWAKIKTTVTTVFNAVKAFIGKVWDGIKTVIKTAVTVVKTVISTYFKAYKTVITTVLNAVKAVVSKVWDGIKTVIKTVVSAIKTVITTYFNVIKTTITTVFNTVKSVAQTVWNAIKTAVSTAITGVITAISTLADIPGKMRGWFNQAKDAAIRKLEALVELVTGIPDKIIGALGDVGSMLYESGKAIVQGLIDGIGDMAGNVKDAVGGILSGARDMLPFSPAKEGPFSGKGWTLYSGRSIAEALADGITGRTDDVVSASRQLADAAHPGNLAAAGRRAPTQTVRERVVRVVERGGQLFGDVYPREEVDVDVLAKRLGFVLNGSGLGGGVSR